MAQKEKLLELDIMRPIPGGELFIRTLRYKYSPVFAFSIDRLYAFILEKLPTLSRQRFNAYIKGDPNPIIFYPKNKVQ